MQCNQSEFLISNYLHGSARLIFWFAESVRPYEYMTLIRRPSVLTKARIFQSDYTLENTVVNRTTQPTHGFWQMPLLFWSCECFHCREWAQSFYFYEFGEADIEILWTQHLCLCLIASSKNDYFLNSKRQK